MSRLIVFDLDGTLIDSSAWLLTAVNRVLKPWLDKPWGREELVATAGGPEHQVFAAIVPPEEIEPTLLRYGEALREPGVLRPQPGVEAMLDHLEKGGYELAVFSGAGKRLGELRLAHVGWQSRFPVCVWGDEVAAKPSPEGIVKAVARSGGTRETSLYIGDTPKDAQAAREAGVGFLGVEWGDVPGGVAGEWNARTPGELAAEIERRWG